MNLIRGQTDTTDFCPHQLACYTDVSFMLRTCCGLGKLVLWILPFTASSRRYVCGGSDLLAAGAKCISEDYNSITVDNRNMVMSHLRNKLGPLHCGVFYSLSLLMLQVALVIDLQLRQCYAYGPWCSHSRRKLGL